MTCLYFLYICSMEERYTSFVLHKFVLFFLKIIPMLMSAIYLLNTILSYFDIDAPILSFIGGVSVLPLIFFYLASYAFRFCAYHRMFLHYIAISWVLNIIDYYWGIPVSDKGLFLLYMVITGIFLFLILYFYLKCRKKQ